MRHRAFHFQGFLVSVLSNSSVLAVSFLSFQKHQVHQNILGNQSQQQRLVFNSMNTTEKLKLRSKMSIGKHTFVHAHKKVIQNIERVATVNLTMQHICLYAFRIKSRDVGFRQEYISVEENDILLLLHNTKRKQLNQVLFERLISIKVNNSESSLVFYADLMLLTQFFSAQ